MENFVLKFNEFINEELNYIEDEGGVYKLEDRWFYYSPEDDIIFGCDERPVGDDKLFSFNPKTCTIIMNNDEKTYDVNNPTCLITYKLDKEEVVIYTDKALEYLQSIGFKGQDITTGKDRNQLMDMFETDDDTKYILLYGDQMIASTFDVIEEN